MGDITRGDDTDEDAEEAQDTMGEELKLGRIGDGKAPLARMDSSMRFSFLLSFMTSNTISRVCLHRQLKMAEGVLATLAQKKDRLKALIDQDPDNQDLLVQLARVREEMLDRTDEVLTVMCSSILMPTHFRFSWWT